MAHMGGVGGGLVGRGNGLAGVLGRFVPDLVYSGPTAWRNIFCGANPAQKITLYLLGVDWHMGCAVIVDNCLYVCVTRSAQK